MSKLKHVGININTAEKRWDLWVDGVLYPATLADAVRFSYEDGELRLKVGVWAEAPEDDDI
jgi:hypothetical protein